MQLKPSEIIKRYQHHLLITESKQLNKSISIKILKQVIISFQRRLLHQLKRDATIELAGNHEEKNIVVRGETLIEFNHCSIRALDANTLSIISGDHEELLMDKNIILIPKEDKVYELKRKGNLVVTCENNSNNNNVEVIQKSFCENNNIKEGELFHLEDINECLNAKSIIKTPKGNTFIASKIIKASKNLLKEKSRQQNFI